MSFDPPKSRNEAILQNMLGANNVLPSPKGRVEELLIQILEQGGTGGGITPEQIAAAVAAYLDEHPVDIDVDSELSGTSENPVQNKIIKNALDAKGTYSKPDGGIPATDLAAGVIPTAFEIPISEPAVDVFTTTASAEDILAHADNLVVVYAGQKIDCSWHTASQFFFDWHDEVYPQFIGFAQFVVTIQNGAVSVTNTSYTSMSLPHEDADGEPLTPGMIPMVNSQGVWEAVLLPSAESNSFGGGS